jgi:hypothetical protein
MPPIISKDSRSKNATRDKVALSNQSFVYELFEEDSKLTIAQLHSLASEELKKKGQHPFNERTIRRCVEDLTRLGFLKTYGRSPTNAVLYGRTTIGLTAEKDDDRTLINWAGELISVEDFVRRVSDPEINPFRLKLKANVISDEMTQALRQRLLYVILSAGSTGQDEQIKKALEGLHGVLDEVNYLQSVLTNFVNSPVWYAQYRDPIGFEVREMQRRDPELFKLAIDCMKGN